VLIRAFICWRLFISRRMLMLFSIFRLFRICLMRRML
jgi:hypothetical protein